MSWLVAAALLVAAPVSASVTTVNLTRTYTGIATGGGFNVERFALTGEGGWQREQIISSGSLAGTPFLLTFSAQFDNKFGYWQVGDARAATFFIGGAVDRTASATGIGFGISNFPDSPYLDFNLAVYAGVFDLATAGGYFSPYFSSGRLRQPGDGESATDWLLSRDEDFVPLADDFRGEAMNAAWLNFAVNVPIGPGQTLLYSANGPGIVTRFQQDVTITTQVPPAPVPEPAAWAMMIVGFGLVGGTARMRRLRPTSEEQSEQDAFRQRC